MYFNWFLCSFNIITQCVNFIRVRKNISVSISFTIKVSTKIKFKWNKFQIHIKKLSQWPINKYYIKQKLADFSNNIVFNWKDMNNNVRQIYSCTIRLIFYLLRTIKFTLRLCNAKNSKTRSGQSLFLFFASLYHLQIFARYQLFFITF